MTGKAVYLGEGVWWRVSARLVRSSPRLVTRRPLALVTSSLDAAMTMVPEGLYPGVGQHGPSCWIAEVAKLNRWYSRGTAATPALALTAAALRALAARGGEVG
jgi:hypothetical protein